MCVRMHAGESVRQRAATHMRAKRARREHWENEWQKMWIVRYVCAEQRPIYVLINLRKRSTWSMNYYFCLCAFFTLHSVWTHFFILSFLVGVGPFFSFGRMRPNKWDNKKIIFFPLCLAGDAALLYYVCAVRCARTGVCNFLDATETASRPKKGRRKKNERESNWAIINYEFTLFRCHLNSRLDGVGCRDCNFETKR